MVFISVVVFLYELSPADAHAASHLSRPFRLYAAAAMLVAFGFADFSLIAFHFAKHAVFSQAIVPVLYAGAMGASGLGSLVFGRWFDARGLRVLVPGIVIGAVAAPFAFLGGAIVAIAGVIAWGLSAGIHDAIMQAGVARMVPEHARARAYGIFMALYGVAWFLGSVFLGLLYDVSLAALVTMSVVAEIAALAPLTLALRALRAGSSRGG